MGILAGELAEQLLPALCQLQHGDQLAPLAFGLLDRRGSEPASAPLKTVGLLGPVVVLDHHGHLSKLTSRSISREGRRVVGLGE